VLPGFNESHLHLFIGGAEIAHLRVHGLRGERALARAIPGRAAARPDLPVIVAHGADCSILPHPASRADLDAILPIRPVIMFCADHRTGWANTRALRAAGLLQGRRLGHGNEIVMGPGGLATGELREFEALVVLSGDIESTPPESTAALNPLTRSAAGA